MHLMVMELHIKANLLVYKKLKIKLFNYFFFVYWNKGIEDLSVDRDDKLCIDALFRLKNGVRVRGEHKQKIQLYLALDGVKVIDESTKV
jgi:hypothetical protein